MKPSSNTKNGKESFNSKLGPGILLAGAAIGGSHLVASTQAGANYGWSLLGILLLVNLFKYPFFLYSQRYTASTGETILDGYLRLGKGYLWVFFLLNILTGIVNIAGVSMITGSLALNLGFEGISVPAISAIIMILCVVIILAGGFGFLRDTGKLIVLVLGVSTIAAMVISIIKGEVAVDDFQGASPWTMASFGFVIVFMGWMPAPIDVSVWPSLWMKSQEKISGTRPTMKDTMFDFHAGYIVTVLLAIVFLVLGRMVMYGSGVELSSQGSVFSRQLIDLYTQTIGEWAHLIIVVAAFSAMFSTSLTTIDGYPRSLSHTIELLFSPLKNYRYLFAIVMLVSVVLGYLIIARFQDQLGAMLSMAMILSFLTAPIFAWFNYRIMFLPVVEKIHQPSQWMKWLSVSGIVFLAGFGIVFILWYLLA